MHCAESSLAAGELVDGTGSDAIHWIAVEYRRPWRPKAVVDNDLPEPVAAWLRAMKARPRTRPVLVKQRKKREGVTVLYAHVGDARVHRFDLPDHDGIPNLPWEALFAGHATDGRTEERPVLVCTHSGRDHCCGLHGAGVARALHRHAPGRAWQCTHLGGHRFAATAVALPEGVHYGRLREDDVPALLEALERGRLHDLDRLRGRTLHPAPAQAAEHWLRREHGLLDLDAVQVDELRFEGGDTWRVDARVAGTPRRLRVQREAMTTLRHASCGADPTPPKRWVVRAVG
jgi:hypothetical protein